MRLWIVLAITAIACTALPVAAQDVEDDAEPEPLRLIARPAPAQEDRLANRDVRPGGSDYRIGRQDLLELRVFDLEEFDQTVRVSDDGSITLPLLGRLEVAGLTKGELERTIETALGERYVRDPHVTIFVREYESKKISVTGAVRNPGAYEMLGSKTLIEMLSGAGGLDRDYGQEIIVLRPKADGTRRKIAIDLEGLVYDVDPRLNITLAPGDIVYVPAIEKIRVFVGGAVKSPNVYEVPRNEPVTVLKAITLAGGTTERAAEKKVQILRTHLDGTRGTYMVDLRKIKRGKAEDPILQKDDVVFVQEAFF